MAQADVGLSQLLGKAENNTGKRKSQGKKYIFVNVSELHISTGDSASSRRWEAGCKISDREVSGRRWSTWRDTFSLNSTQQKRVLGVRKRDSYL